MYSKENWIFENNYKYIFAFILCCICNMLHVLHILYMYLLSFYLFCWWKMKSSKLNLQNMRLLYVAINADKFWMSLIVSKIHPFSFFSFWPPSPFYLSLIENEIIWSWSNLRLPGLLLIYGWVWSKRYEMQVVFHRLIGFYMTVFHFVI